MFKCKRCNSECRDGVQCSVCRCHYDFPCAGITEGGFRKLGDRKATWRCASCKNPTSPNPPVDLDDVMAELKRLSAITASLPQLADSVKSIHTELAELKNLKSNLTDVKESLNYVHNSVDTLSSKICNIEKEIQILLKTKDEVQHLQQRMEKLEGLVRDGERRSRMNNIEIKGVPVTQSENLFQIFAKLGEHIKCPIPREQINYIARIPMRNDKVNKTIIVSVHNRYNKEDFVAAARKSTIVPADLNLSGNNRIFVNDHLNLEDKLLLNKVKTLAKEKDFAYTWVKGCKIYVRKSPTSHVIVIKSEADLKKLV
ncbi:uncharacterized protein LOC113239142 [Hyposmocoma kahamanoa]|uniref:uncharacterized protein LOC113229476 n=1 Tax=Hyposmocoma kahamanoa TaxID=1477025 RepID=UPI000E6D68D9|nr:uncharacterized protein LOC113229476 [Hyposmocoma kahamanoa]XP_026331795.1 uncharacterized protein LOC113239142 [Hyposmocoma kahamanoa]